MTELFKQDYKTFDKPEIFWVFKDYGVGHIEKHYIYGYRKYKNNWYIKVKNLVDSIGSSKRAKPRYVWTIMKPNNIDKDKNWIIQRAINSKIAKMDKTIKGLEEELSSIPEKIERIKQMKSKVSQEQYNWKTGITIETNLEKGVDLLKIKEIVKKYYSIYSTMSF